MMQEKQLFTGTAYYEAPPRQKQVAGIKMAQHLAQRLVRDCPEIADIYRKDSSLRQLDMAKAFLPNEYKTNREIAKNAVGKALRILIPPQELNQIIMAHKEAYLAGLLANGYFMGEEHRRRSRKGGEARTNRFIVGEEEFEKMLRNLAIAQGRTTWTKEEKGMVLRLAGEMVNYKEITERTNRVFHQSREVRTPESISINVRSWRFKSKH